MYRNEPGTSIKVIGVSGGGMNAVNHMIDVGLPGLEFIAIDFDGLTLEKSKAPAKLQLTSLYPRLIFPEFGEPVRIWNKESATARRKQIRKVIGKADVVFIVAGLGGDVGSGIAPVIAETARETGALTIAVTTRPFSFEGRESATVAEHGINELRSCVDTLIVIPLDGILKTSDNKEMTVSEAFDLADDLLWQAVWCIVTPIAMPHSCMTHLDLGDISPLFKAETGRARIGILTYGWASGENQVTNSTRMLISCPFLKKPIKEARAVLATISVMTDPEIPRPEIREARDTLVALANPGAEVLYSATLVENQPGDICITAICVYDEV